MCRRILPGLLAAVLVFACATEPAVEPELAAAATLCDEGWTPAPAEAEPEMTASLRAFSERWLERLREGAATVHGASRAIGAGFEVSLVRATAPVVGVLRYCEQAMQCEAKDACHAMSRTIVTEIFRHDGTDWVY